jgi:hypothetical protein
MRIGQKQARDVTSDSTQKKKKKHDSLNTIIKLTELYRYPFKSFR